jgi:hypothetical protein
MVQYVPVSESLPSPKRTEPGGAVSIVVRTCFGVTARCFAIAFTSTAWCGSTTSWIRSSSGRCRPGVVISVRRPGLVPRPPSQVGAVAR